MYTGIQKTLRKWKCSWEDRFYLDGYNGPWHWTFFLYIC